MDLYRLEAIQKAWKRAPPVHLMIAGYLGYLKKDDEIAEPNGDLSGIFAALAGSAS